MNEYKKKLLIQKEQIDYLERMIKKYRYDNLTGLKMRTDFEDDFFSRFSEKDDFYLTVIDLDDLKSINNIGYLEGDKAIRNVGHCLADKVLGSCYRIGGDEFAVLSYTDNKGKFKEVSGITYSRLRVNYDKFKSTGAMFGEVDKLLHILKKGKKSGKKKH